MIDPKLLSRTADSALTFLSLQYIIVISELELTTVQVKNTSLNPSVLTGSIRADTRMVLIPSLSCTLDLDRMLVSINVLA
jgi:hypothetical protein